MQRNIDLEVKGEIERRKADCCGFRRGHLMKDSRILWYPFQLYFYFMYVDVLCACKSVYHMCAVITETRRGCQNIWKWSYRWLVAVMGVQKTKPASGRVASVLNLWGNSPTPSLTFLFPSLYTCRDCKIWALLQSYLPLAPSSCL